MALERGKIRTRRRGRRYRGRTWRRAARGQRSWRETIKFALARSDFCDRKAERGGAERRRGAIDLGGRALDHLGLPLPVLKLCLYRGCRGCDLRQARVEPQDGLVQLPRNGVLGSRRIVARRLRDLFDLARDRVQPLMNVSHISALLAQHHLAFGGWGAKIGKIGIADSGIEPVVQRHAGASCGSLGPLANGGIDAFNTPRYARIHAFVRFRLQRATCAFSLPRVPEERQSKLARVVCL